MRRIFAGLGVGALLCVAVAAYFGATAVYALLHYDDYAEVNPQFSRYVAIPGLLAAGFLLVGLFGRRWARVAGVYGASVLAGLFLFEGFMVYRQLPVWFGMIGRAAPAEAAAPPSEETAVGGFTLRVLNNRAAQADLSTAILSGFPGSEVVLCAPEGRPLLYRADRFGFNNPADVYAQPAEAMLLGDSFVEGFCLPAGEDVAGQMRARGVSAVNLGIRGNGPLAELAQLGRFGPLLRPRNVVMVFFEGNDWENLEKELATPWLRKALAADADFGRPEKAEPSLERALTATQKVEAEPVTFADLLRRRAILRNFLALQQTGTALGLTYPKIAHPIAEYDDVLRRAKGITDAFGGAFLLVYVPQVDRYLGTFPIDAALDPMRHHVRQAAETAGIPVLDLTDIFHAQADPMRLYGADGHFSREGAALAAAEIGRLIERPEPARSAAMRPTP